ncbi:uncharacterized protein LOC126655940 [Mercurialis annua]|uniref:uncharacterized protein LOC126655940 n=1 Tax=Mercurialis annua TaxID=3986 RepID=UPI00215F55F3|nr:uncharacterized protein LOC126655940 [Mercurialis annua]
MSLLTLNCCSKKLIGITHLNKIKPANYSIKEYKLCTRAFAKQQKSVKKLQNHGISLKKSGGDESSRNEEDRISEKSVIIASRNAVLQACTVTSGLLAALGFLIRQVSHVASVEGLPILDCSAEISFGLENWHLELIIGLVILISSSRYLLLKTWPDFAESSEAANQQVLTSLEPLDYAVVSFLPGISEELLFRGALLPLFGMDWKSALAVAAVFGILHLGNGRNYSFAIWATFVGLAYGYAAIASSSITVPMASHALNNLVGGILWRSTSKSSKSLE